MSHIHEYKILDGAMGTELVKLGLQPGQKGEFLNIEAPDKVIQVHKSYIDAGAKIIYTNTFGISRRKLEGEKYTTEEVLRAGVRNAKLARGDQEVQIALSLGSIGEMMEPMGTLKFEECYDLYREQAILGEEEGVDLIVLETITDLYEMKAAILAVKENTRLPLISSMSFESNGRTFNGCLPESFALTATSLGVDVLGINCSLGPFEIYPLIERVKRVTDKPLLVKANAGLPDFDGNYGMDSDEFVRGMEEIAKLGVAYLGGCCGTGPDYISKLSSALAGQKVPVRESIQTSAVCSPTIYLPLDDFIGVGEKINPSGRPDLKAGLERDDWTPIMKEALRQAEGYCQVLDINVGTPGVQEARAMTHAIKKVQEVVDLPLQIDSSHLDAIEAGLRAYNGKPIVNSVSGEEAKMDEFFPVIKKYGASFIGLCLDENGIPETPEGRFDIAEKIVNRAISFGIPKEDIIIDTLALTISSNKDSALIALETIELVKNKLGVKTILGVSNISFGLPHRDDINSAFLAMAMDRGLDLGIIDPINERTQTAMDTYRLLKGKDPGAKDFIAGRQDKKEVTKAEAREVTMVDYLFKGLEDELARLISNELKEKSSMEIMNHDLIPALDQVGKAYEREEIFLPQLIKAASTAGAGFNLLKASLAKEETTSWSKGEILLATVEGDIHDIGKNIVKVILENYGYDVIDLGKDVPVETIIKEAQDRQIRLVGLSALMTTTLNSMEATIRQIKALDPTIAVMVGGAVLTKDYAKKIGADFYVGDAREDVEVARKVFKEDTDEKTD